jgi:serine protease Do
LFEGDFAVRFFKLLLAILFWALMSAHFSFASDKGIRMTPVVRTVQSVAPAVVNIHTARIVEQELNPFGNMFDDTLFRHFFGPRI